MDYIKKHKAILGLIILIVTVVFIGQKLLNPTSSEVNTSQTTLEKAEKGNITSTISASGQIETANYLSITTSASGIVSKVYVKEGDTVVKGQKIMDVTLDSEGELSKANAYSSFLRAKNSLESAKSALYSLESAKIQKEEAFRELKESSSYQSHEERTNYKLAENDYIKAKNDYDQQAGTIAQMQIALNSAWNEYQSQSPTITAPAGGIVANIISVEGTKIENSVSERSIKTVASIKQSGTPIASLNVSELDINKVIVGQNVKLKLNSDSQNSYAGKIVGIDKIGTQSNGVSNYPVIVKFDIDSEKVLPNMGVDGEIIVAEKQDIVYVPSAAVKSSKNESYVVDTNGNKISVSVGISDGTITEIVSGVNEGDIVQVESLPKSGFTSTSQSTNRGFGAVGVFQGR